jgi:hypothetical protein
LKKTFRSIGGNAYLTRLLISCLVLGAGTEFIARGPLRALRPEGDFNDFLSPYVQARIWFAGGDPYDPNALVSHWPKDLPTPEFVKREARDGSLARLHGVPSPYPVTAFPLLLPVALAPWRVANLCWILFETLSFMVFFWGLLRIARARTSSLSAAALAVAILPLAPVHTAFAVGNPVVIAVAFATWAVALHGKGRTVLPALLLAFAAALKPTVALPFLLFFAIRKHWTTLAFTGVAGLAMFVVAQVRMSVSGTDWLTSFVSVNHGMFSPGGVNDFSSANPIRFDLVNIQVVMSQFVASPQLAQYLSIGVALVALLVWWRLRNRTPEQSVMLDLAIASMISLLPVYHRFYDVALIVFPVAWAITEWRGTLSRYAWVSLAAAIPFLVPGTALLSRTAHSSAAVEEFSKSWWWYLFIAPHQVWLVVAMLITLLLAQGKLRASKAKVSSALAAEAA